MKKLLFFDLSPLLLDRIPKQIINRICNDVRCDTLHVEAKNYYEILSGKGLAEYDGLVIFGHRLPDILLAIVARYQKVPVFYVQHGLFQERLSREFVPLLALFKRKLGYYIKSFFIVKLNFWRMLKWRSFSHLTLSAFVSNAYLKRVTADYGDIINVFFLYDEAQKEKFTNIFNSSFSDYVLTGILDAGRVDSSKEESDTAIFICQSLVEDGRMIKNMYLDRLRGNVELLRTDGYKVILFLHQRSDIVIYENFKDICEIVENRWYLPAAGIYLTDYSSLILEPMRIGKKVSRILLSGHSPMSELCAIPLYPNFFVDEKLSIAESPFELIAKSILDRIRTNGPTIIL